jgi:hypothetical protein
VLDDFKFLHPRLLEAGWKVKDSKIYEILFAKEIFVDFLNKINENDDGSIIKKNFNGEDLLQKNLHYFDSKQKLFFFIARLYIYIFIQF